uniref:Laminin subunit alpha-2-like n=1 Tax=Saccoglossus kowalevskii TaxID=10224 RepID=A0ABM0M073_SACKO
MPFEATQYLYVAHPVPALETNRLQSLVTAADAQFTDMQSSLDNTNQILGTATDSLNRAVSILNDTQDQVTFAQNLVSEVETSQNNINTVLTTASSDITSAGQLFSDTLEVKNGGSESTAPVPPSVNQLGYNGWTSVLDDVKSHTSSVIDQQGNAEVFVRAAEIYASKLYNTSRDTLEVFQEAQDHGQPAVDAIDSYQQAITTLEEATAKAVEANTTIAEALNYVNEVSVSKIQEEAASSQTSSNDLKNSVENRNTDPAALQLRLTEANGTLAVAEQTWAQVEENYAALQVEASGLDLTSQDPGITPIVTTATSTATKAILDANEVITASTILNEDIKIDQQNVVIVQQSVANATVLNAELDTLVPQIESDLVDLSSTVDTLTDLQNETSYQRSDINSRMAILQQKLAQAQQAVANSKQPVHFSAHSSMQYLRSEPLETYLYNSISLKVKAETPNGLLFFTENDPADVLMAIEVINGHPVFRFNLGQDLVSVESPVDICCNSWYEIIATRYGYESRISVKDMTTGGAALEYTKSVVTYEKYLRLGLDSVLFVGGLPVNYPLNTTSDSVPELDESSLVQIIPLQNRDYVGCLSNVQFDDQELNLWLADLQEGSMTCCNRPTIVTPPDPALTDGVSFTGYGYMELPMETFDIYSSASMSVEFRTSMKDAVLILLSRPDLVAYIGLYIYNRKLLFQYKLSGALVQTIETVADFNDATWYKTTCGFNSTSIFLSVESSDGDISESYVMPLLVTPITFPNLQTGTRLTLGSSIDNTLRGPTNLKFAGCMRKLMLTNGTSMNLIPRPMTNTTAVSYSDVSFSGCLAD